MSEHDGGWVALFSGGKESSWALCTAQDAGREVHRLIIVHPLAGSHVYHAPAMSVIRLAAKSTGIPIVDVTIPPVDVEPPDIGRRSDQRSKTRDGDAIETLESGLRTLDSELDGGLRGVIAGIVESDYRADRLRSMCDRIGCDFVAPLWHADPHRLLETMIDSGLEIVFAEVAAPGFDESWLGRRLDRTALDDLESLHQEYGVHLLGEGGEFETIVTDGPHMSQPIALEFEREWDGAWGRLRITDTRFEAPTSGEDHRDTTT
ncbi:diphthine--ammonia ligase [Natrinema halophilum]|uniref:diphthine--ammonia ligase n=1 Tax=Natrinema halophilum TaxID=1699371 RepID=UPI001F425BCC|nr:diphthine--ammonia ligase [Natrinema halophilum]UHQ96093.1 diphthine--ammonia ligase [Natrinema halophilum]